MSNTQTITSRNIHNGQNYTPIRMTGLPVFQRRLIVIVLGIGTALPILWINFNIFRPGGISFLEGIILFCTAITSFLPIQRFVSCVIGLCVIAFGNIEKSIHPYFDAKGPLPELKSKTALTIFMRNEDPTEIFNRIYVMRESLRQTGCLQHFRFVLLSDTDRPQVIRMEEEGFTQIKDSLSIGMSHPPLYRRRSKNIGYKAGNCQDYIDNHSAGDEFFVALDSDSIMGGDLLVRLVSSMEKYPQIGLLQTMFHSIPSFSAFTRVSQFGSCYCLRALQVGTAWWTSDCALYLGHNAIIRTEVFRKHCRLPILSEKPPLGSHILSHDIIESMFMRRGGYEVHMLPVEADTYEGSPPTFIDFLRRELRWCQETMQYLFMLKEPGIKPVSRAMVYHTILTYLGPVCWLVIIIAFTMKSLLGESNADEVDFSLNPQILLICFSLSANIAGVLDVAVRSLESYGGVFRFVSSVMLEVLLSTLTTSAFAISVLIFVCGLCFGHSIKWDAQNRNQLGVSWRDACRVLWPQTLIGFVMTGLVITQDRVPIVAGWLMASSLCLIVPFTVFSASPYLSDIVTRLRLFTTPAEVSLSPVLSSIVDLEVISMSRQRLSKRSQIPYCTSGTSSCKK